MALFERFRRPKPVRPEWPRATGPVREVELVANGAREGNAQRFLPADDLPRSGALLDLSVLGPTTLRPGDAPAPEPQPVHRIAELTHVRSGTIEHRDSLGHRGQLTGPATRLVSGGAGLLGEVGLSRELRRDGGPVEVVTVRWAQPKSTTPTVRVAERVEERPQGRSRVVPLVGPDAAVASADGARVLRVDVASGATVDLAVPATADVVVAVQRGTALVGEGLTKVDAGGLAVLAHGASRVTVATTLEGEGAALLLVATPPATGSFSRQGLVVGDDTDDVAAAVDRARTGAFGRLPGLDG